jgi:hypothetical protein
LVRKRDSNSHALARASRVLQGRVVACGAVLRRLWPLTYEAIVPIGKQSAYPNVLVRRSVITADAYP